MKIKIRKTALLLFAVLCLTGCSEEKLNDRSVIDDSKQQIETTQLDNWILDNITKPYGIEVVYRWEKNAGSTGTFIHPPKLKNIRAILEAVRELGLETYRLKEVGGTDFLLGRLPIKLYLYGGGNPDENGVERLHNPQLTAAEMCLYNVNGFNPGDADKMFVLMRSVHHQLAKRLMQLIAYDRDKFFTISGHRYTGSTESIAAPLGNAHTGKEKFGLDAYANKRGFYTMLSFLSAEDDFAEIISATLTSTPKEVYDATVTAKTPDTDVDPEVNARYAKEAEQAYKEFTEKQAFVNEYVQKNWHINLKQMQVISVRRINAYVKQQLRKMNNRYMKYCLILTALLLAACSSNDDVFDKSPSQRSSESIATLKDELVNAPYGWRVLYFPKTDSLLFSNPSELISQHGFRGRYGYGGDCFTMKFAADNTVEMRADFTDRTAAEAEKSEYLIGRNSFTQLSFSTYNYIHRLVNDRFAGASDFLYMGKNEDGDLVFRTATYLQPAREYIVFTKLKSAEETTGFVQKAYDNRTFFEQMINPQLRIHRGGRTYFRSDIYIKRNVETNQALLKEIKEKKYYLFLFTQKKNPIPGYPAKEMTGLGSGYAGTEHGITFRAGLRYDRKTMFFDFQREGNRFVAELVSVYDPLLRTTRLVSKHLHPEGEFTGLKAEIWDEPTE